MQQEFEEFLRDKYSDDVGELAGRYPKEQKSILVDWMDLFRHDSDLAYELVDNPSLAKPLLNNALRNYDLPVDVSLPHARARLFNVSDERELLVGQYDTHHINKIISIRGQVRQLSMVRPRDVETTFECLRCGTKISIPQSGENYQEPHECQGCERQGPFDVVEEDSVYVKHQLARIETPPEHTKSDAHIDVHLRHDLTERLQGNERVIITGKLGVVKREDSERDNDWTFDAESIEILEGGFEMVDKEEHREEIEEIASLDDPIDYFAGQLAPELYRHPKLKLSTQALVLGMVGAYDQPGKRTDSHLCVLGDPGVGKSEALDGCDDLSPRSRLASGKGVSGAGLTAAAARSDFGPGEWTAEAGLLPRANNGVACLDEIDKVDESHLQAIHRALEQQQVDFSKAGLEAHFQTKTTLLATGNPKHGRFNPHEHPADQIDISPTLMSRFDLILLLKDDPDEDLDKNIADVQIDSWTESKQDTDEETDSDRDYDDIVFQAYIAAAKDINPEWTDTAKQKIKNEYVKTRSVAHGQGGESPMPVTARKLPAFLRLAEASARARHSQQVTEEDAERAISLVWSSLNDVGVDPETGELDADVIEAGMSKSQRDRIKNISSIIDELAAEYDEGAPRNLVIERAENNGIDADRAAHEIDELKEKGEVFNPSEDRLRTT